MLCALKFLFGLFVWREHNRQHAVIKSSTFWILYKLAKEEEVFHQMCIGQRFAHTSYDFMSIIAFVIGCVSLPAINELDHWSNRLLSATENKTKKKKNIFRLIFRPFSFKWISPHTQLNGPTNNNHFQLKQNDQRICFISYCSNEFQAFDFNFNAD